MKYPIGIQDFRSIINGGYVYVDKTALIYDLVTQGKVYFLSRPRRFGKSLLVSTLKYYFEGEKELFKGLAIDKMEKEWKKYPVFQLSFNGLDVHDPQNLVKKLDFFVSEGEKKYGLASTDISIADRFANLLKTAYNQTGLGCVVLIDEYDKPLLDVIGMPDKVRVNDTEKSLEEYNRDILKGFYSVLKDSDPSLQFVLLTGVTKFSQVSVFSGFNQPKDISMNSRYDAICGITTDELNEYFTDEMHEMAVKSQLSDQEMKERLKRKYDGYHFSEEMLDIYNPFSLLSALDEGKLRDYWFSTGTPTYLLRLLSHGDDSLNELVGNYYDRQDFIDYKADVEKPLPMIYQSGYLTIKGYDPDMNQYLLDFPNEEVTRGFLRLVSENYFSTRQQSNLMKLFIDSLKSADLEQLKKVLTAFLSSIPYSAHKDTKIETVEKDFQLAIYILMRLVGCYTVYHEKESSEGRADCVVETKDYVYILEYKLDHPASEALAQIEKMGYAREYAADPRKLYKIGCSFSSKTRTISDWLVEE